MFLEKGKELGRKKLAGPWLGECILENSAIRLLAGRGWMRGCLVLHWKMLSMLHLLGIWSFSSFSFSFPEGQFYKEKKKNIIYI